MHALAGLVAYERLQVTARTTGLVTGILDNLTLPLGCGPNLKFRVQDRRRRVKRGAGGRKRGHTQHKLMCLLLNAAATILVEESGMHGGVHGGGKGRIDGGSHFILGWQSPPLLLPL